MPSNDASEVVVGANGRVLVAPVGGTTVYPTNVLTAFGLGWTEVGFTSEDGVTFTNGRDVEDIGAWQSIRPIRKLITGQSTSVEFVLRQWNDVTIKLAMGGGTNFEAGNVATYTPPLSGAMDERSLAIEWTDDVDIFRLVLPRGIVTGETSSNITRSAAADLPISFEVAQSGTPTAGYTSAALATQPWYLLTNSDGFLTT